VIRNDPIKPCPKFFTTEARSPRRLSNRKKENKALRDLRGEYVMALVEPRVRLGFRLDPVESEKKQGLIGGETGCDRG
jgi:hypothetical protein